MEGQFLRPIEIAFHLAGTNHIHIFQKIIAISAILNIFKF